MNYADWVAGKQEFRVAAEVKRFEALLTNGVIEIKDGYYIGKASDGVWVQLGEVGEEEQLEEYLTACPTPDRW